MTIKNRPHDAAADLLKRESCGQLRRISARRAMVLASFTG